ncbi:MAG: MFS transporter [Anaerolineales bacterium]|jgi:MFS family permease
MATFAKLIRNRSLVVLGASESVSNIGNWITMMAVFAMIVFKGDGSILQSSAIFLAGLLPTLVFSPAAGWLIDHFDRKWLMVGSELFSGLIIAALIFVKRLELIYAILALQAISTSIMTPARQAVVPDIVSRQDLTRANAFFQQLAGLIKIGAPMIAGLILAVVNPHHAIILDVISFVFSAIILSRLPSLQPHPDDSASGVRTEKPSGGRKRKINTVLKESPRLRLLFLSIFLGIIVIVGFDVIGAVFIRDVLKGSEGFFGLLIGLVGLGTLGASVLLMLQRENHDPWRDVVLGMLLLATLPASLALGTWVNQPVIARLLAIGGSLLGGVGNGLLVIQMGTLLQLLSPPALLGRMGGVFQSTAVAGQLVGIVLTPLFVPGLLSMGGYLGLGALALGILVLYTILTLHRSAPVQSAAGPAGD